MNIWFAKTTLIFNTRNLKFNFIKKLYIRIMYIFKYKYKYINNLQLSFENLFILLEYHNHNINIGDIHIRSNLKLKNIIYIDDKEYSIRLDIDKISWMMNLRIKDLSTNNIYYLEHSLNENIENLVFQDQKIYSLLNHIFKKVFSDFIKE